MMHSSAERAHELRAARTHELRAGLDHSAVAGGFGRRSLCAGAALALLSLAAPAGAGRYLDTVSFLLDQATREADYLRYRLKNPDLARVVHALATTRVRSAGALVVPEEVARAHPHLLLVLENYERAADAAVAGEAQRFLVYRRRARDEQVVLRAVLRHLGFPLPPPRSRRPDH